MTLEEYFSTHWQPKSIDRYIYTGYQILNKIKEDDLVIDVGCGYNPYKEALGERLVGIDPYNDQADFKISIEEFETDTVFDAAICFGSINFGDDETIKKQIQKVLSWLKPGGVIYWRQNPGLQDHDNPYTNQITFYDWSFEKNLYFASLLDCKVNILAWDTQDRIYAEWLKPVT